MRAREAPRSSLHSDGDRSYAANASRIPSSFDKKSFLGPPDPLLPQSRLRGASPPIVPPPLSERASPEPLVISGLRGRGKEGTNAAHDVKPRVVGKGKTSRPNDRIIDGISPGSSKTSARRNLAGSSRVTSIARHFDRLSRDAERERQKRLSLVRGKRARPVGITKAKVQVFNNVRDAFKDESDTDSSEADNEEDDHGSEDSADSAGQPKDSRRSRSPRNSLSPQSENKVSPMASVSAPTSIDPPDDLSAGIPISASSSSITGSSIMSDTRSDMSFTDRLQIELPSFETSAPLPSIPVTPQLSADTADEGQAALSHVSHISENELSSGGERSSILKTLSGLWAFRAGDFTPLEYPLSVPP